MIDDALDGAYAHEQEYGYTETGDVGHVGYGDDGGAIKLASALNYVAANLNDLGTTEEKIAELELFSEMLKEASEESATAEAVAEAGEEGAEALKKGLGESWSDLKTKGVGDVWKNMSGTSKAIVGGGAGLVGLGALYGGYKALGGGSEKKSSLDEARSRAFAKVAQRYDIPVHELEGMAKEAVANRIFNYFMPTRGSAPLNTALKPDEQLTDAELLERSAKEGKARAQAENREAKRDKKGAKKARKIEKKGLPPTPAAEKATAEATEKAVAEAAEELGFLAKNRRTLLAAGGLGAAGLAGYGLYRAMKDKSPTKTAGYMSKVAEDRINPARIRAGASDPFSGFDIRSQGGGGSRFDPIALRAQRIRAQINSDMQGHVNNVGGGYNLERYLNRFNK